MYKSIILPLAKKDIRDAALWYNTKQKDLGKRFAKQIRKQIHFIQQNPTVYVERYDNVRTASLNRFPFMIHYLIDFGNKTIIVSAVFHTSQNPDSWKKR